MILIHCSSAVDDGTALCCGLFKTLHLALFSVGGFAGRYPVL